MVVIDKRTIQHQLLDLLGDQNFWRRFMRQVFDKSRASFEPLLPVLNLALLSIQSSLSWLDGLVNELCDKICLPRLSNREVSKGGNCVF